MEEEGCFTGKDASISAKKLQISGGNGCSVYGEGWSNTIIC